MPWRIERRGTEHCVVMETTGEVEGCHPTRRAALAQQRALYASEAQKREESNTEGPMDEKATWSAAHVNNLPDSSFLYVEPGGDKDEEGKTTPRGLRHFPYKDADGTVDLPHLRNALSRLGQPATGRNWKKPLSPSLRASLTARARKILGQHQKNVLAKAFNALKALFAEPEEEPPVNRLLVWKEGETWRWLAIYSNKFRDEDSPPEILTEAAHKEFVAAVDKGEWPHPRLMLWHVPGTEIGVADWLAYDDQGFSLASGTGDAAALKALAAMDDLATSHGMPSKEIRRDDDDPTVITRYRTEEISALPRWAAANKLTRFTTSGGETMAIDKEKREFLAETLGEERTAELEEAIGGLSKSAAGIEFKEEEPAPEEEGEAQAAPEPEVEEKEEEDEAPPPVDYATRDEVAEAVGAFLKPLVEQINALSASVEALGAELKHLQRADEEKIAEAAELTPAASLADMIGSVIGRPETKVDGRTKLGGSEPKETPPANGPTFVPMINEALARMGR